MTSRHPDIELLSSLVDGVDEEGAAAHVEGCEACRHTVAALTKASAAVATPVPFPAADDVDRAVPAALAASEPRAEIVAIRPRRRHLPGWAVAVAAAILLVAAAVPLIGRLSRSPGSDAAAKSTAAAGPGADNSLAQPAAGDSASTGGASASGRADLGPVDDSSTLRARVRAATAKSAPPSAAASDAASGGTAGAPAPGQRFSNAPGASPTTAPPIGPNEPCLPAATAAASVSGTPPAFSASLFWQGTPALVYEFVRPDSTAVLTVIALERCQVLATVTL